MIVTNAPSPKQILANIASSGLSIYDSIEVGDPDLWLPSPALEEVLSSSITGLSLSGLPLRTRSKVVKEKVCNALGYPIPKSFQKTQPRFPGQQFDTYIQKSSNLQVWNEELSPTRRYVIIKVSDEDIVEKVKVVTGSTLSTLDTTGTLTQKYQARLIPSEESCELVSAQDSDQLSALTHEKVDLKGLKAVPTDDPSETTLLTIATIFEKLKTLIGATFKDTGFDQERNRGGFMHGLACKALGYASYKDDGRFPDIRNQLLEVKLQTSPTIDLGLVTPNSSDPLDVPKISGVQVRHCDVRYALFYGKTDGEVVSITNVYLTTGEAFFKRFPQFQGKVLNKKLQIPLPKSFFD